MFTTAISSMRSAIPRRLIASRMPATMSARVHTLPPLPYAYDALEPHISKQIMELHHTKHHQTYVNGLNAAEEQMKKVQTTQELIGLQAAIKFNGGGHINHSFFWKILAPTSNGGGKLSEGKLKSTIEKDFGTVEDFKKQFNTKAAAIQGSGWCWLGYNSTTKKLEIVTTPNQDPLLAPYTPIIGIDMWEHAFYLQYKNVKPDYLSGIWNVINFQQAETLLAEVAK